ncbi:hypothetical protein [Nonlabens sp.]|uniref:hypothetical protein n=1 Tax=Nonlabens sp. TaxID=1888209 RepID=UPI001BD11D2D|nr:hypothetical protein [Nonlabens sp.]
MIKNYSPLKALGCSLIGHRYQVSCEVNDHIQELCCCTCHKQMTRTIYGKFVPLNERHSEINRILNHVDRKRKEARM